MKAHGQALRIPCVVLALSIATIAADSSNPNLKFTQVNIPGAVSTSANGINNAGVIVGSYEDSGNAYHGFIMDGSTLTTLDDPNGTNTNASDLNANGTVQVVGSYTNSAGKSAGFLYSNGVYTDIPGPTGAVSSFASDINDNGVIVGGYTDSSNVTRAYVLKEGKYSTLGIYMAAITIASGINDDGYFTLWYVDGLSGVTQSRIYNSNTGTYQVMNVPGAMDSLALDINNAGDVAYEWTDANYVGHGAVLHQGNFHKLDYPGSVYDYAQGINDNLQIVGGYEAVSNGPLLGFEASK